jgi:F420-non-reducing hydrogenase iron-sulfur subunit
MCTGRVDLSFLLRAFSNGMDGVLVGGCWPGACHYVTEGNLAALGNVHLCRKLMERVGIDPQRLRIEWMSAAEGGRFATILTDFVGQLKVLGPLGLGEGASGKTLALKLEALTRLVPYIKLVEREKLRVPSKSEAACDEFFAGGEVDRLLQGLVADKLAVSEILLLLEEEPRSSAAIAKTLGLTASEVSRHMKASVSQGWVRYDGEHNHYRRA